MTAPPEPGTPTLDTVTLNTTAQPSLATEGEDALHEADTIISGPGRTSSASTGSFAALKRIDRFIVLRKLGEGGMGVVYAAYDERLDRKLALKLLRSRMHSSAARRRMAREAQGLAKLSHPNVVAVHELGEHEGSVYLAMEFVAGQTLRAWLRGGEQEGPRPWREILAVFAQAGQGLAAAHAAEIVHRDFKPDNVMVGDDGRVRVMDFGLARAPGDEDDDYDASEDSVAQVAGRRERLLSEQLTRTGTMLGTPAYMSPEQFECRPTDARSDQFSFCVALYESLYGQTPFPGETLELRSKRVCSGQIEPLEDERGVPRWLHTVLLRGLEREPGRRFESMEDLLELLAQDPERDRRERRRLAALLVGVALLVGAAVLGVIELRARALEREQLALAEAEELRVEQQIERARARGDLARAHQLFEGLVARPELQGTEILVQAWLTEAKRRSEDGELDGAKLAYARAYELTNAPRSELDALVGIAGLLQRELDWEGLARALERIDALEHQTGADAGLDELRVELALLSRDLGKARALIPNEDPRAAALDALGSAQITRFEQLHCAWPMDLEGDGRDELMVHVFDQPWVVVRGEPELGEVLSVPRPAYTDGRPVSRSGGRPALLVHEAPGERMSLSAIDSTRTQLLSWPDQVLGPLASGDLDGDGEPEIYVGTGPYTRRLVALEHHADADPARDPEEAPREWSWSLPERDSEAARSDFYGLQVADLDGDGQLELAAATGPWSAYDLRVLRRQGEELELVAREQLGNVQDLQILTTATGERLLLVAKDDRYTTPALFGPERPTGAPAGLHLLRFDGEAIERVAHFPLPHAELEPGYNQCCRIYVGDVDGDGDQDIAASIARDADGAHTLLLLQGEDTHFESMLIGQSSVHGFLDVDEDPAQELVLKVLQPASRSDELDEQRLWILGAGEQQLPLVRARAPAELGVPLELAPSRAAELEAMGLLSAAALAFEDLFERTDQSAALERAALLRERLREDTRASELFARLRERPEARASGLQGLVRAQLRQAEYATALELSEALLELPDFEGPQRDSTIALRDQLRPATSEAGVFELRFDRPLDPRLRLLQPQALHHELARGTLLVEGMHRGELASIPVTWDGGHVMIELDYQLEHMEWGNDVELALVSEAKGESVLVLGVEARGGGGVVEWNHECQAGATVRVGAWDRPFRRLRARASMTPALAEEQCVMLDAEGERVALKRASDTEPLPAGEYRLVLRTTERWDSWGQLRVHGLRAVGLRVRAESPAPELSEEQLLARAIVGGQWAQTLDLLATRERTGDDPFELELELARVDALALLGRLDEAKLALAAVLEHLRGDASDEPRELYALLRRRPSLHVPLLRSLLGPEFAPYAAQAWSIARSQHLDDPRVRAELLALPLAGHEQPDASQALLQASVSLLRARATIHADAGSLDRARTELLEARALLERLDPSERPDASGLGLQLAELELASGDAPAARSRVRELLTREDASFQLEDRVRARPGLAALLDSP